MRADQIFRDIVEARTFSQFQAVIQDAASVNPYENTSFIRSLAPPTLQPQLIIQTGASGGILTQSEYQLAQFCTEQKLKKRTSDRLIRMI